MEFHACGSADGDAARAHGRPQAGPSLEYATKLVEPDWEPGWRVSVYPGAGEAGGSFQSGARVARPSGGSAGVAADPERSAAEAARRARGKIRRYCSEHRLNRLGTLTYRGIGNHDPRLVRAHVGEFFRMLRPLVGGSSFPYVWVPEWHSSGHGLHVHFAVGRYMKQTKIAAAWPHGFVHIKLIGDLPVGSSTQDEARRAAGYLAKYVGKTLDGHDGRPAGLHRYDVAQGFEPHKVRIFAGSMDSAIYKAANVVGREPRRVWQSASERDWSGPPAMWVQF